MCFGASFGDMVEKLVEKEKKWIYKDDNDRMDGFGYAQSILRVGIGSW